MLRNNDTLTNCTTEEDGILFFPSFHDSLTCDEIDFQRNNTDLTRGLVNYAINAGARLFIFFSTISVYGSIGSSIVSEETPCKDPDPYSLSKLESEAYLAENQHAISSLSLRLPSVMGPGARYGWLTGVVAKMRRNEAVTFVNPDTLFNNAVHIADLAHFIDRLKWAKSAM